MLTRVCDICGRAITGDMAVVETEKMLMNILNPYNITIACPRDNVWDLCPSCREKLYSWVKEQKAAERESMEERCNKEVTKDLARLSSSINEPLDTIHRIRNKIREARRKKK